MTENNQNYPNTIAKFNNLLSSDDNKDIEFLFEDTNKTIKAHKFVLEAISSTFKTMFNGCFMEKNTATIHGIPYDIFGKLINVIYLIPIEISNVEEAVELYNAAEMYDVQDLKDMSRVFMVQNCYWDNCLFLYDKASLFKLTDVIQKCQDIFITYDYQIFVSHLFSNWELSEEAFMAAADFWTGEHGELYQLLETYVEIGKIKTYSTAIRMISFLAFNIDEVLVAKLLTSTEKCAIIANIKAGEQKIESFIPYPDYLSKAQYVHRKNSEARKFMQLIWIAVLLACRSKEYSSLILRKCLCLSASFLGATEYSACQQAFGRLVEGERIRKNDFELLAQVMRNRSLILEKYEIKYEGEKKVKLVEISDDQKDHVLFSYEF